MTYICIVPVAPLRAEATHRSEQVSQLLFGELAELMESSGDFSRLKCRYDDYDGWCQTNQLVALPEGSVSSPDEMLAPELVNTVQIKGTAMQVPFGSSLWLVKNPVMHTELEIGYIGQTVQPSAANDLDVTTYAYKFLNTAYQWGGRSVFGVDCSGFTQTVFRYIGVKLSRDAYQQALQGEAVGFLEESKTGDLAFFDNEQGRINHVGILLSGGKIIHSSGKVRIDTIDNMGIVNSDTGKRTHKLRLIKRCIQP